LEKTHRGVAAVDPNAAGKTILRIQRAIGRLLILPYSGRPGVVSGTRLLAVPGLPYIVVHRIRGDVVEIIAVLHTARRRRS
jgi:plasmid stabilization system protein ParE